MKISTIFAAIGMMAATVGGASSADAQRRDDNRGRYEQRGDRDHRGDRYDRRDRDDRGRHYARHDRGNHYGRDRNQRCRTVIRHQRRVRVCR